MQKERIEPRDIFVLTLKDRSFLRWPVHKPLKQSACTPLFYNAYTLRDAGACIHTHSQHAVMVTLLWPGKEFRISHQEMIKGMRLMGTGTALSYLDTLVIPIIENTPDEEDLREGMEEVSRHLAHGTLLIRRRQCELTPTHLLCSYVDTGRIAGVPVRQPSLLDSSTDDSRLGDGKSAGRVSRLPARGGGQDATGRTRDGGHEMMILTPILKSNEARTVASPRPPGRVGT